MTTSMRSRHAKGSVDPKEMARFKELYDTWWNPDGEYAALHRMNPARLDFILEHVSANFGYDLRNRDALRGLRVLDVGCGGGLLAEPVARLGAEVSGIDPVVENITTAKRHAERSGLSIDYRATAVESLGIPDNPYDAVLCMDVIEHVREPEEFLCVLANLVSPGGVLAISTISRTPKSYALAILGAERVLRWVPRGTHKWRKFVRPNELRRMAINAGLRPVATAGIVFDPIRYQWRLHEHKTDVNYAFAAIGEAVERNDS